MNQLSFEALTQDVKKRVDMWLSEPHVQEFWDNTQGHKDDIVNFIEGRKTPSSYCDGKYSYWLARDNGKPFAMLMSLHETIDDDIDQIKKDHLSRFGHTIGIDFMIGDKDYIGKGYGGTVLSGFVDFYRDQVDSLADTFIIDPDSSNPRAKRVYEKAGFKHVGDFIMGSDCSGQGKRHHLLLKCFPPKVALKLASSAKYPLIQNMARFYVYDLSKDCGHSSIEWTLPQNGLYESFDFKLYFEEEGRIAYLVRVYDEIAGFVLINTITTDRKSDWNMGEFFILAKFQGNGLGQQAAECVLRKHPGQWEISIIPENVSALKFWHNVVIQYSNDEYSKEIKLVDFDANQPNRVVYTVQSPSQVSSSSIFKLKKFSELKATELYDIYELRQRVFVLEQECLYPDIELWDKQAQHLCLYTQGKLSAYARIMPEGTQYSNASIGRILTDPSFRGQGFGEKLVTRAIEELNRNGVTAIQISAQYHLQSWYERFGFVPSGKPYMEDGIPHILMFKGKIYE